MNINQLKINENGHVNHAIDRRCKLTPDDKINIKKEYFEAEDHKKTTIAALSKKYNVHKRSIQFILFPERAIINQENQKKRRSEGKHYNKKKEAMYRQSHRSYKKKLYEQGIIGESET